MLLTLFIRNTLEEKKKSLHDMMSIQFHSWLDLVFITLRYRPVIPYHGKTLSEPIDR